MKEKELDKMLGLARNVAIGMRSEVVQDSIKYRIASKRILGDEFMEIAENLGEAGLQISRMGDSESAEDTSFFNSLTHGLHIMGLFLAIYDFIRIPLIYLTSYLLNKPPPITLNNNARWLYATTILALIITAVAVPVVWPIISFVLAGLIFAASSFLLGKVLYERYQLGKERKILREVITQIEEDIAFIQNKAGLLEARLKKMNENTDDDKKIALIREIADLHEKYESKKTLLFDLKSKEIDLDKKIKHAATLKIVDKTMASITATLALIGFILFFIVPPVGLAMGAISGAIGGIYFITRIVSSLIVLVVDKVRRSQEQNPPLDSSSKMETLQEDLTLKASELFNFLHASDLHESTGEVFKGLGIPIENREEIPVTIEELGITVLEPQHFPGPTNHQTNIQTPIDESEEDSRASGLKE